MSSLANMLKMYLILQTKGSVSSQTLCTMLEVDKRTIRRYKQELEYACIPIEATGGCNSLYRLIHDNHLLNLNATKQELLCLESLLDELKHKNHILLDDFESICNKINLKQFDIQESYSMALGNSENYQRSIERQKQMECYLAIMQRLKLQLDYMDAQGRSTKRMVHPYKLVWYQGGCYLIAFCELKAAMRFFKLSRIKEWSLTDIHFKIDPNVNLNLLFEKRFGMFSGQEVTMRLKIKYPLAQTIKEKTWIKNQAIKEDDQDHAILYEATVEIGEELTAWLLSMGDSLLMVEPECLQVEIKNKLIKMMEKI